jgi:hypothetical protein
LRPTARLRGSAIDIVADCGRRFDEVKSFTTPNALVGTVNHFGKLDLTHTPSRLSVIVMNEAASGPDILASGPLLTGL